MSGGAVISGGAVAIFAFALASGRDSYRAWRQRQRHDDAVLAAIREEIAANRRALENNQNLLDEELKLIPQGNRLVNPLDPLEAGFWDLVKLNPPRRLETEDWTLSHVREVARLTAQVNEMLRSRENFRVLSPSLTMTTGIGQAAWAQPLEGYDKLVKQFQGELLTAIDALESALV